MPIQLLPASAAAFAPRAAPNVVLGSKPEPWLTQTLKRINRVKRPLNSIPQHTRCLTETLSGNAAIWSLCSIMLPKAPDSELRKDSNPLVEAMFNYQLLHLEAYVVHIDMVSQHEVAFKLTPETIEALTDYHKDIYSVDVAATTWNWAEKDAQLKKLQDEFVQAVNRYVFRTGVRALEGMEEDGAGELLEGRSEDVKNAIMGLFLPLLPPPPRIVDVVRPTVIAAPVPVIPSSPAGNANWWQYPSQSTPPAMSMDPWRVLPSTPSPTITTCSEASTPNFWTSLSMDNSMDANIQQLPSPTPSFESPFCSVGDYSSPPLAPVPLAALPLPSVLAQQCGTAATGSGFGGYSGFGGFGGFSNYGGFGHDFAPQYASIM